MTIVDIVIIAVVLIIVGLAILKIVSEKKKGHKCIGCPHSGGCDSNKKKG